MRQQDGQRHAVRDLVTRRQRVRTGVRGTKHRLLDGEPGVERTEVHRAARVEVARAREHRLVVGVQESKGLAREEGRDRRAPGRGGGLDRVRDRVEAGGGSDRRRLRERELRVEQGDLEGQLRIAAGHLHVRLGIDDDRIGLHLRAGAGRRRNRQHRQHRLRGLPVALVVGDRPAVCQQEIDPLRAVEGAAASQPDDRVDVARRRDPVSPFDHRRIGVDVEVVERDRLDSLIPEQPLRPLDMTDVLQTVVGDEEGLLESERARQHPEPLHGA